MVPIISVAEARELDTGSGLLHSMALVKNQPSWDGQHLIDFGIAPREEKRLIQHPQYEVRDFSHSIVSFVGADNGCESFTHASKHPIITSNMPEEKQRYLRENFPNDIIDITKLALYEGVHRLRSPEIWRPVSGRIKSENKELAEIHLTFAITKQQFNAAIDEHKRWRDEKREYRITGLGVPNCEGYAYAIARAAGVKLSRLPWPNLVGMDIEDLAYGEAMRLKQGKPPISQFRQASSRLTTRDMALRAKQLGIPGSEQLVILDRPTPKYLQAAHMPAGLMLKAA